MNIKFVLIVLAATGAVSAVGAQTPFAPEPETLWPGPMQGATPKSLKGATVIDAAAFVALVAKQDPVLVDVANLEHRPEGRAPGLGWTPIHRSVPGAIWLPGAGTGKDAPGFADAFAKRIEAATGGDRSRPIITFCHPQRWGSWNAAKRLTALHYEHVYWYPGGSEGWAAQGPLKAVAEDRRWQAYGFDKSSAADMPDAAPRAGR